MLTDCPHCWSTPCTCGYAYWFMPYAQLVEVATAASGVLSDRANGREPPPAVLEEQERQRRNAEAAKRMTSEDWGRSFTFEEQELLTLVEQSARLDAPVPHSVLDDLARRKL